MFNDILSKVSQQKGKVTTKGKYMISTGIQSRARVYKKCPRCESLLYCTPHGIKHKSFFLARIYTVQCTSVCRFVPGSVEDTRTLQNTAALTVCYQLANLRFRCEREPYSARKEGSAERW